MQIASRKAGDIIADSMDKGPLYKFLIASKNRANEAMEKFAYSDPTNVSNLVELQVQVRTYIDLLQWVESQLEGGKIAEDYIAEEYDEDQGEEEYD